MPTFAQGRTVTPTSIDSDGEYHPIILQDIRASTGAFTYVDSVGGLQVATAGLYQIAAEVRWHGGTRMVEGWHAIRVRLGGPLLDGWVANDKAAQIYDVNTAVIQNGLGLQYLNPGDRFWIEAAHQSFNASNVDAHLGVVLVAPLEYAAFYGDTEDVGPFRG